MVLTHVNTKPTLGTPMEVRRFGWYALDSAANLHLVHDVGMRALHAFESTGAGEDNGIDHNKN
jgi:hypothetical protein